MKAPLRLHCVILLLPKLPKVKAAAGNELFSSPIDLLASYSAFCVFVVAAPRAAHHSGRCETGETASYSAEQGFCCCFQRVSVISLSQLHTHTQTRCWSITHFFRVFSSSVSQISLEVTWQGETTIFVASSRSLSRGDCRFHVRACYYILWPLFCFVELQDDIAFFSAHSLSALSHLRRHCFSFLSASGTPFQCKCSVCVIYIYMLFSTGCDFLIYLRVVIRILLFFLYCDGGGDIPTAAS
jgi:hypothetical protein